MLVVPQGLYISVYLTFGFHHNKSEQSKLEENNALNLKPSYFPFLSCLTLHFTFSYILHHSSLQGTQPFSSLFYSLEIQKAHDNLSLEKAPGQFVKQQVRKQGKQWIR